MKTKSHLTSSNPITPHTDRRKKELEKLRRMEEKVKLNQESKQEGDDNEKLDDEREHLARKVKLRGKQKRKTSMDVEAGKEKRKRMITGGESDEKLIVEKNVIRGL